MFDSLEKLHTHCQSVRGWTDAAEEGSHLCKLNSVVRLLPDSHAGRTVTAAHRNMAKTECNGNLKTQLNQNGLKCEEVKRNGFHIKRGVSSVCQLLDLLTNMYLRGKLFRAPALSHLSQVCHRYLALIVWLFSNCLFCLWLFTMCVCGRETL